MSIDAQGREPIRKVLVVVPTLNEVRGIEAVVDSLSRSWPTDLDVTLAVADGGSTDGTVQLVLRMQQTRPWLRLLDNPRRIQSAAVNLAARTLGQDAQVLVRCDAHAVYPPDFVARLLQSLESSGADAVVVPMDSVGDNCVQRAVAWVSDTAVGSGGSAHRGGRRSGDVDHGHHAAFRMASFQRAGGYDETFTHNEDAELDCRQRRLGSRIYLDADIRLQYHPRASLGALARQYFAYGRGRSRTVRKHPGSMRLRQLALPVHLLLLLATLLLALAWPWALLWPAAYLGVLALTSLRIAWRKRSLCGLLAGPAALTMHLAWALGFLCGMAFIREPAWQGGDGALPTPRPSAPGSRGTPRSGLSALLVDPSLFTAPYDAALTEGLLAAGVDVRWATRPTRAGDRQELPLERTDAFFYRRVDDARWLRGPLKPLAKGVAHVAGLITLLRQVRRQRPDVVHLQWVVVPPLDVLAMAWLRRRCPLIFTVHDTVPFNGQKMSLLQRMGHDGPLRLAHRLIVHTRLGRQALIERGVPADKIALIPHGPLTLPVVAPPVVVPRDTRWTCVLFGEIKPYKGLDLLIEAVAALRPDARGQLRVVVAGRARMDIDPLLARIGELGLDKQFDMRVRRQSEEEMAVLFEEADCFLFPYRQIDASGVYFLVKGLRKWMIASQVGIFTEDLRPGVDGELVGCADVAALSAAIGKAVETRPQPDPRSPPGGSWLEIGQATRQLYERAIAEHASQGHAVQQPRAAK